MQDATTNHRLGICLLLGILTASPSAFGQASSEPPSEAETAFFEAKIRPVLIDHCHDCHSSDSGAAEGGLQVDTPASLRRGGEHGPAVVPGEPESSWLLTAVTHADPDLKMPPKQPRLPDSVIADLTRWIETGAHDPRSEASDDPQATTPPREWDPAAARDHWAYRPLTISEETKAKQTERRAGVIKTEPTALAAGLDASLNTQLGPEASAYGSQQSQFLSAQHGAAGEQGRGGDLVDRSWARRELDRFILAELKNQNLEPSPDASPETLLRRLHFDLVGLPPMPDDLHRFQQTISVDGLDVAVESEVDRLLALPQFGERWGRHWLDVARFGESSGKEANISFPYAWRYRDYVIDAFNRDLPFDRFLTEQIAGDLLPHSSEAERARLLIATGFLAMGPKNLSEMNKLQFFADVVDEQIDSVTRAVMASSVACARCHDHKFDPFSMQDYYALAGLFASTETYFGTAVSPANRIGGTPLPLPVGAGHEIFHASIPADKVASLEAELAELQQQEKEGRAAVRKAIAEGKDPSGIFTVTDALRIFWRSGAIRGELNKVSETGEALPLTMGVLDREQVFDAPLLKRGDIGKAGDLVPRGFPQVITLDPAIEIPEDQSGRRQFAQWLTHPQHPLTSRVMVNRVWQHLFGVGLVRTVDNFGTTGEPPSHPELLDHLAVRFIQNNWSVKYLVREIVLSRTYRQASDYDDQAFLVDPDNTCLWRVPKRRLEAEVIRDAMLAVSGELDLTPPAGSLVGRVIKERPISLIGLNKRLPNDLDGAVHRSVYLPVIRDRLPDVLDLFDFAEPSLVTGQRETTNVPTQALYLMNSPFVQDRAEALADRLINQTGSDQQRVRLAFEWCYNRRPDPEEEQRALEFLNRTEESDQQHAATASDAWTSFCQALLSTAEFRNLD